MLWNTRLLNSVLTNSLTLFTTQLHDHHSPSHQHCPKTLLIYQSLGYVLGAEQHLLWNARCSVIMLGRFSSPPSHCKEIICSEHLSTHAKYLQGKQNDDQTCITIHTNTSCPVSTTNPLLLRKHLQLLIGSFSILSLFLCPIFFLLSLTKYTQVAFSVLAAFGGQGIIIRKQYLMCHPANTKYLLGKSSVRMKCTQS